MTRDIRSYIAGCIACARWSPKARVEPLNSINALRPWELLQADLLGPFPESTADNVIALTVVCCFSGFSATDALPDKGTQAIVEGFDRILDRLAIPIASYLGNEFESVVPHLEQRGTAVQLAPPAAHRPLGAIEGMNRIIRRSLERTAPIKGVVVPDVLQVVVTVPAATITAFGCCRLSALQGYVLKGPPKRSEMQS